MNLRLLLPLLASVAPSSLLADDPAQKSVEALISQVREIRMMKNDREYTLEAGGVSRTGDSDSFLRARSVSEIRKSGLSTGCGDYALAFCALAAEQGFECKFVDSAQVSRRSLKSYSAGHAVVALHRQGTITNWWLVDPTNKKILSQDWDPKSTSFRAGGHLYWIGYCGPPSGYPVNSPASLKEFYRRTVQAVPQDVLAAELAAEDNAQPNNSTVARP